MRNIAASIAIAGLAFHGSATADDLVKIDGRILCGYGYIKMIAVGGHRWLGYHDNPYLWLAVELEQMPNYRQMPYLYEQFAGKTVVSFIGTTGRYYDRRLLLEKAYHSSVPVQITVRETGNCSGEYAQSFDIKVCGNSSECYPR